MKILRFLILSIIFAPVLTMASVHYTVRFSEEEAKKHQVDIQITIDKLESVQGEYLKFKVPVWTPGSYKVREFSQHFTVKTVFVNGTPINFLREDKNTWAFPAKAGDHVTLNYSVYAFEQSVRQSYIDEHYAFLHGVSAFGYFPDAFNDIELEIKGLDKWKDVYVAAPAVSGKKHNYKFSDYDLLADSPIALGNFDTVDYTSGGVPHIVVMIGHGNYDLEKIRTDFKKMNDAEVKIFGSHPSTPVYIHFIYNVNAGGGGLEHLNSQTSMFERFAYTDEAKYKKFLGLIAHEYFHLWNVKRIAPMELGPFDYDKENYSDLLWVAEGFTSYYDDLILYRTGIIDQKEYLGLVAAQINRYENTIGKKVMSLDESSRLAWIKAYLPNENSSNTTISYYNKGMLVALAMELRIQKISNGKQCLDELMKALYENYKPSDLQNPEGGINMAIIVNLCKQLYGESFEDLFEALVYSTDPIDYQKWFEGLGIEFKDKNTHTNKYAGLLASTTEGRCIISRIDSESPAEKAGLSVKDELISIDGWRIEGDFNESLKRFDIGQTVELIYSRDGKIRKTMLAIGKDPTFNYELIVKDAENKLLKNWLRAN